MFTVIAFAFHHPFIAAAIWLSWSLAVSFLVGGMIRYGMRE